MAIRKIILLIGLLATLLMGASMPYKVNTIAQLWTRIGNKAGKLPAGALVEIGVSRTIRNRPMVEIVTAPWAGKYVEPRFLDTYSPAQSPSPTITVTDQAAFDSLMNNAALAPGSVVILSGNFTGNKVPQFAGTAEAPIQIIGVNAHLDGSIYITTPHTHWRGLSITAPADRYTFYTSGAGTVLEYCDLSGGNIGIGWFGSGAGAIRNCTIHDTASYGLYTHNHNGGLRIIQNNTFSNIGGYYSMHFFSDANRVRDYVITGNTISKPVIVHSGVEVSNITFIGNTFHSWVKIGNGYSSTDTRQAAFYGNSFLGAGGGVTGFSTSDLEIRNNTFAITIDAALQQTNIYLLPGGNHIRTIIDGNQYTGGKFISGTTYYTWAAWQAAGYDLHGSYQ